MKDIWRNDPQLVPKGLSCSETKEGEFVLAAAGPKVPPDFLEPAFA